MNTGLTPETDQTIINFAHAFDGYAYAQQRWPGEEGYGQRLSQLVADVERTGRLAVSYEENAAANFGLHRGFHHQGWLPEQFTHSWFSMVFLYLHLYRLPVPVAHRHAEMYAAWAMRTKGSAEAAAAEIRQLLRRQLATW